MGRKGKRGMGREREGSGKVGRWEDNGRWEKVKIGEKRREKRCRRERG